jgi:large subunit ribosomal protein L3
MRVGMLGRKVGMTQIYETDGTAVPITVLECGPCTVLQVRTADRDGYHAVQLGFADKKRKSASQAERGHAKKANAEPKRFVREIRQPGPTDVAEGQTLTVDVFDADPPGRRHRHQQGPGLLGRHEATRLQGAAGDARRQADAPPPGLVGPECRPGPYPQGDPQARQFGNARITVKNLKVVRVDKDNNLLLIRGAVPGPTAAI